MSFLESKEGLPDFNKAVISLWFRIPQATIDACVAQAGAQPDPNVLIGRNVIPLIVFGGLTGGFKWAKGGTTASGSNIVHTGIWSEGGFTDTEPTTVASPSTYVERTVGFDQPYLMSPSMIAIECDPEPRISVNLQTPNRATRTGLLFDQSNGMSSSDIYIITNTVSASTPAPPDFMRAQAWSKIGTDVTDFFMSGSPETFFGRGNVVVSPDIWHHLLISFDLSGAIGNGKSGCRMWMALDDVNYNGEGLPANTFGGEYLNTIFAQGGAVDDPGYIPDPSWSGWSTGNAGSEWVDMTVTASRVPITYRFTPEPLKAFPFGIPAPSVYASSVRQVQMAELQIFTGVTLDTSVEKNRRAFINSRGQPVDPLYGLEKARGIFGPKTPNSTPSPPIKLLGKMPDISLTRAAGNWARGENLGSAKISLKPTGKIKAVTPDPVVGK